MAMKADTSARDREGGLPCSRSEVIRGQAEERVARQIREPSNLHQRNERAPPFNPPFLRSFFSFRSLDSLPLCLRRTPTPARLLPPFTAKT